MQAIEAIVPNHNLNFPSLLLPILLFVICYLLIKIQRTASGPLEAKSFTYHSHVSVIHLSHILSHISIRKRIPILRLLQLKGGWLYGIWEQYASQSFLVGERQSQYRREVWEAASY